MDLLSSGFYGLHLVDWAVAFEARWANPLWDLLEIDVRSERENIPRQLSHTLVCLPLPVVRYISMSVKELDAARLPGAWPNLFRRFQCALETIAF